MSESTIFQQLVSTIAATSPLQKKRLEKYLADQPPAFFRDASNFADRYLAYLEHEGIQLDDAVKAYARLCNQMVRYQVRFATTGNYPASDGAEVYEAVYGNDREMKAYMIGLAISLFLWPTHYQIFSELRRHLQTLGPTISSYLEIGPGHGVFLSTAAEFLPRDATLTAVDISATSIAITRSVMAFLHPALSDRIRYEVRDLLRMERNRHYDFIVMGEVLEHFSDPRAGLRALRALLSPTGHAFVSTCVDCPAADHLWHFRSVAEIRDMLESEGFRISAERVLPVENLPMEEIAARRITINYCALLTDINPERVESA